MTFDICSYVDTRYSTVAKIWAMVGRMMSAIHTVHTVNNFQCSQFLLLDSSVIIADVE